MGKRRVCSVNAVNGQLPTEEEMLAGKYLVGFHLGMRRASEMLAAGETLNSATIDQQLAGARALVKTAETTTQGRAAGRALTNKELLEALLTMARHSGRLEAELAAGRDAVGPEGKKASVLVAEYAQVIDEGVRALFPDLFSDDHEASPEASS